ncbi:MAG: DNA-binding response regulator [Anaerolineae bacterium CG_4_9_14_3_um_filter_57_17]|nr:MAG: DNA-binding response regulator [Anaerolineae bacterium CG_4_9_14_3_um_filter_57_17]
MSKKIRVLIADDHAILRSGVKMLLEADSNIEVVGEALDGNEALKLVEQLKPDVTLMDIAMPGMDGLEATRRIKAQWPEVAVLVLTMHRSEEYFFEMLKLGASGYLLKGAQPEELINAVQTVARGEIFLYPSMAGKLVRDYVSRTGNASSLDPSLSPRENEILRLLVDDFSSKEIAEKLVVSISTVHTHRNNLMRKLGLSSRRELIQYARQKGLLGDGLTEEK